jgi:hypothetical protein
MMELILEMTSRRGRKKLGAVEQRGNIRNRMY